MFLELVCMKLLQVSSDNTTEDYKNYSNSRSTDTRTTENSTTKKQNTGKEEENGKNGSGLLSILQIMIVCVAIYISVGRNDGFSLGPFLLACCYPTFYLLYALVFPVEK